MELNFNFLFLGRRSAGKVIVMHLRSQLLAERAQMRASALFIVIQVKRASKRGETSKFIPQSLGTQQQVQAVGFQHSNF